MSAGDPSPASVARFAMPKAASRLVFVRASGTLRRAF
eukprot:gene30078-12895_t